MRPFLILFTIAALHSLSYARDLSQAIQAADLAKIAVAAEQDYFPGENALVRVDGEPKFVKVLYVIPGVNGGATQVGWSSLSTLGLSDLKDFVPSVAESNGFRIGDLVSRKDGTASYYHIAAMFADGSVKLEDLPFFLWNINDLVLIERPEPHTSLRTKIANTCNLIFGF